MDFKELAYEEDLLRNPYSLKNWWYYLEYKQEARREIRYMIYERAVQKLPGSYKLWFRYLNERMLNCKSLCVTDISFEKTNNTFERALVHMHKMPRIWKEYLQFLISQKKITETRRTFDRALKALPITQHVKWIWPMYLIFAKEARVPETSVRIWRRYLKINPLEVEEFIKYLKSAGRIQDAAQHLSELVNDDSFTSQHGKSKHDLWQELLKLITSNPTEVKALNVDAIIRSGIKRFSHEVGQLWVSLADYYIRASHFSKAYDIFEEGIGTVSTVRDFDLIFEAYSQYLEQMLKVRMETSDVPDEDDDDIDDPTESKEEKERRLEQKQIKAKSEALEIDLQLLRLENLMSRQPLLLSSVLLRQNPHNVPEWHKRVTLFKGQPEEIIKVYTDAVTTVDPQKAVGKPHTLWVAFARLYEQYNDLDNARVIFDKAALVNYKGVDDLASIWCERVEMELRHGNYAKALETIKQAAVVPAQEVRIWKKGGANNVPVQKRLYKSTKLWSLYADLEENLGSLESTRAVYDQMLIIRVATPAVVVNYALILEEKKFFEESFRVYEKGIGLFDFPHVYVIWITYLKKFIGRFGGTKLERTRDLFEQSVEKAPAKEGKKLYLLYAKFEEQYGLARRAMNVYDRCCKIALPKDRLEVYSIYIARCEEFFGVTKTREIYEQAIQNLPEDALRVILIRYAALERKLGEIDRARAIYGYSAQYCDPRSDTVFWKTWHDFEVLHGNEDTFRDMLRIRRSVQAQFAQVNITPGLKPVEEKKKRKDPFSSMEVLEQQASEMVKEKEEEEAKKKQRTEEKTTAELEVMARQATNPEEIDIGDVDVESQEATHTNASNPTDSSSSGTGALARFKGKPP